MSPQRKSLAWDRRWSLVNAGGRCIRKCAAYLCACVVTVMAWSQATAQPLLPEKISVKERPRPELEPIGVRVGGLRAYPKLSVLETYDDNIFATETGEASDQVTTLTADVALRSDGRTRWSMFGNFTQRLYADYSDENYSDWKGGASIGRAIGARAQAGLSVSSGRVHESRGDPSFPVNLPELPKFDTQRAQFDLAYAYARGHINLTSAVDTFDYADARLADGSTFDQDFRDRKSWNVALRNDFGIGPRVGLFLQLLHKEQLYDTADSSSGIDRDSTTDAVYAGAVLWISNLVRGDLGLGVLQVDNSDPTQDDRRVLAMNASLEFYLTQLLSAAITVKGDSGPSDIAQSASYVGTTGALSIDYEFRRNVVVTASYSYSRREYSGVDSADTLSRSEVQAQWLVNRRARASLGFALEDREWPVAAAGRDYRRRTVFAAVTFML